MGLIMKRIFMLIIIFALFLLNSISHVGIFAIENKISFDVQEKGYYQFLTDGDISYLGNLNITTCSDVYENYFYYYDSDGAYISYSLEYTVSSGMIYTPNGTDVNQLYLTSSSIITKKYLEDHPDASKEYWDNEIKEDFPNLELTSEGTSFYNCHSYAWYSQNVYNNKIWLDYPNAYYHDNDMSYYRVYSPRIGDIICYIDLDSGEMYQNIHSLGITPHSHLIDD